ncbi:hypothetical protein [Elizabethkingia miricola]|uniref:hypothetical protein n=1 Tax=Elizabethkingia miricola TaxID=172045 RepID=UPI0012DB040D|nr:MULTISPECIES: hypothetical protein [Elizabethkingia]NHQ68265.1 hypothetical protein [Elizabethkingia miricola]
MKKLSKKNLKDIKGSDDWKSCNTSYDCRPGNYVCCFGGCYKTTELEYLPICPND